MDKELIIFTGNVGCGKSTVAKNIVTKNKDFIVVNDDSISTMVGGGVYTNYDESKKYFYKCIELYCVDLGLGTNRSVIVDMPNMKRSSRKRFIEIGKRYGVRIISYDWGSGNLEDLERRKKESRDYDGWETAFNTKKEEYEKPTIEEGFDDIVQMNSQDIN